MTGRRQWSTFEYGNLVSKEDSGRVKDAVELPPACFAWLEKCCLNDDAEYDARLLTLKTVGRCREERSSRCCQRPAMITPANS